MLTKSINQIILHNNIHFRICTREISKIRVKKKETSELPKSFVDRYKKLPYKFGFGALGAIAYKRSYAREKEDGDFEQWPDTIERVVNGVFQMQEEHCKAKNIKFDFERAESEAKLMYSKIFNFSFLPPGRGLYAMGTPIITKKKLYAALNNCAFVSTHAETSQDLSKAFVFLMDASMLGIGVGFDTKAQNDNFIIQRPRKPEVDPYIIADSREGAVESTKLLLDTFFTGGNLPHFDYSQIRAKGAPIHTFGGMASGKEPLIDLHITLNRILSNYIGKKMDARIIVDIMNLLGRYTCSGSIRQTAEIAFGEPSDTQFLNLKNYKLNPSREGFGWASNNSVICSEGMDYSSLCENILENGEPGLAWLENMRKYGRMGDPPNELDYRAMGGNPCLEQTLESFEMCTLVETFPHKHESINDYLDTLRVALLYAKTVTLGLPHMPQSAHIMQRNRRIGCSMSGIAQFLGLRGWDVLQDWCSIAYKTVKQIDEELSHRFLVNKSVKLTCVKPSGTVSLLAGATPGVHYPESNYYIRRIRLSERSSLVAELSDYGYKVEPDLNMTGKIVVEIPVTVGENVKTVKEVDMFSQMELAAFMQKHWADNQVSCTVKLCDKTVDSATLSKALTYFEDKLKGISFMSMKGIELYPQLPYEEISKEVYDEMMKHLTLVQLAGNVGADHIYSAFCESDTCAPL